MHPQVNARYDDEAGVLHRHRAVHIGVATQTAGGLMVPVVRHAEALDLWQAAAESRRLAEAARAGKAARDELTGSTITVTSLGRARRHRRDPGHQLSGSGDRRRQPHRRAAGRARRPDRVRQMMNLSSSFDHRIVDGWDAASFIQRIKGLLEQPALLFIA